MQIRPGHKPADGVPQTSSEPVSIPQEQRTLFHDVLALLESRGAHYAVAGAFALQQYTGICRETKDLDVFLTPENAAAALDYLRQAGFHCEVCDPAWLFKAHRNDYYVDLITGMSNAVLVVEQSWIDRARPAIIHGVCTRVLAPEELLASKLFVTHRDRFDGADIAHIIFRTVGKLDWQRILSLAGEDWEMLFWQLILFHYAYPAHKGIVPDGVWSDLTGRFDHALRNPDPQARFRGSIVDDRMFAIDVKEWGLDDLLGEARDRRLRTLGIPPEGLHHPTDR